MILNIRGPSGSGKSHLVHKFIEHYGPVEPILNWRGTKAEALRFPNGWFVIGRYDTTCGGCDILGSPPPSFDGNSLDYVEELVRKYAKRGHVLFEGIVVTSVWGGVRKPPRWEILAKDFPCLFLFLDTPLEVCYERYMSRPGRRSGKRKPNRWDEGKSDIHAKYRSIREQVVRAETAGLNWKWLRYKTAFAELEEIIAGVTNDVQNLAFP